MFSNRVPASLTPNRLSAALVIARTRGRQLLDLTVSNPTQVGLAADPSLLAALADTRGVEYRPEPLGLWSARVAVAAELARRGVACDAERVALTASTSEAYAMLFKLLCEPGDEVLVPRPSYPLFEHLTALEGVKATFYDLEYHGVWSIDRSSVERALGPRTRAILVVSPNNPTGSMLRCDDRAWLDATCSHREMSVVCDEVFGDYRLESAPDAVASAIDGQPPRALTFVLGGLSKSVGLPQLKLAWTAVSGPVALVDAALAHLEVIYDAYLSVSTPVQLALGRLLAEGVTVRDAILGRVRRNLDALRTSASRHAAVSVLRVEGGWSAVVQVPAILPEEELALRLLEQHDLIVHPGYFFDFTRGAFVVASLLPAPRAFDEAISRLLRAVDEL